MREYLELGSVPANEDCVQVKRGADYHDAMREECFRYAKLLRQIFPDVCAFGVKGFDHDAGMYYETVIYYNSMSPKETNFIYFVEENLPANWLTEEQIAAEKERLAVLWENYGKEGEEFEDVTDLPEPQQNIFQPEQLRKLILALELGTDG